VLGHEQCRGDGRKSPGMCCAWPSAWAALCSAATWLRLCGGGAAAHGCSARCARAGSRSCCTSPLWVPRGWRSERDVGLGKGPERPDGSCASAWPSPSHAPGLLLLRRPRAARRLRPAAGHAGPWLTAALHPSSAGRVLRTNPALQQITLAFDWQLPITHPRPTMGAVNMWPLQVRCCGARRLCHQGCNLWPGDCSSTAGMHAAVGLECARGGEDACMRACSTCGCQRVHHPCHTLNAQGLVKGAELDNLPLPKLQIRFGYDIKPGLDGFYASRWVVGKESSSCFALLPMFAPKLLLHWRSHLATHVGNWCCGGGGNSGGVGLAISTSPVVVRETPHMRAASRTRADAPTTTHGALCSWLTPAASSAATPPANTHAATRTRVGRPTTC